MATTIIGYPRIGEKRELKFLTERYFRKEITETELVAAASELRKKQWADLAKLGLETIPSNDFSFYDTTLDTAVLFNLIPKEVAELGLSPLDTYFALARGYQGEHGDVKARPMKKWYNTNYHYLVPKFEASSSVQLTGTKIFEEFQEAKDQGLITRPVLLGPFSLLALGEYETGTQPTDFVADLVKAYQAVFVALKAAGAEWIQLDEPELVKDNGPAQKALFKQVYQELLKEKGGLQVLIQTYFGDVRDVYQTLVSLPVEGIGLDFVEGKQTAELVADFPAEKRLFAGVVNGKNIWRNDYQKTLATLAKLPAEQVVLTSSCSLLHVPYTLENEEFPQAVSQHFAFAKEKVTEIVELDQIYRGAEGPTLTQNQALFAGQRIVANQAVQQKVSQLTAASFERQPAFVEREVLQRDRFHFPLLPTTTIGSFPQTKEVKQARAQWYKKELTDESYTDFVHKQIQEWIAWQTEIGLDVLVHGEFERNDMVEYFGQHLEGYLFSQNGWVQSYGTRGVKPPIIWGDVARKEAITVQWSVFAQAQTDKVVKGMLTGPVTILNWSFPREDISLRESTLQIALAIQEEVLDLEANGIQIIQIDEAALREKLPLRQSDWFSEYLDWAIPAFRLVHAQVQPTTQIHTHMCYSEFLDIIQAIDQMDADVISFEASRSNLAILDALQEQHFKTQVGPGVYDIHSPRVPSEAEITATIRQILTKIAPEKVWINPDCGLKTRGIPETKASVAHLTAAARKVREEL